MTRSVGVVRPHREGARGQGIAEGAVTIAAILVVVVAAAAVTVRVTAQIELDSAVANAAASTLAVPVDATAMINADAEDAFVGTLGDHAWIRPSGPISCIVGPPADVRTPGRIITCTGTAEVRLREFPLPLGPDIGISASARVVQAPLRQCAASTVSGDPTRC